MKTIVILRPAGGSEEMVGQDFPEASQRVAIRTLDEKATRRLSDWADHAALRWSLMALRDQTNRVRICRLLEKQRTKGGAGAGSASALPYVDKEFDVAAMALVITFIPTPGDARSKRKP